MYPGCDDPNGIDIDEEPEIVSKTSLTIPLLGTYEVDLEEKSSKAKTKLDKLRRYISAHISKAIIGTIWMLINIILFIEHFILYWNSPNFYVSFARGFGEVLNFNCSLILIPVLRNLITFLRQSFLYRFVPFDSNIMFHRRIAWTIAISAYGHGISHYINYSLQDSPYSFAWGTLAGITGNLLVFIMVIMYSTAIDAIRRRYFNVFYFAHHLFIVSFILLLLHGKNFWIWWLLPGIAYIIERLYREYRAKKTTTVLQVTNHPSDVVELRMGKKGFKYKSGQYLYLNAPYLSVYEWHPFTITSAPHEEFVSVHIRCVGKWTKGIRKLLAPEDEGTIEVNESKGPDGKPLIRIDGPFGAASEEVVKFKTVMLVGAGIGVTPFASIIKSLYHKRKTNAKCKVEKVYFFWICRDMTSFEWFQTLLKELEDDMKETGEQFLNINIYLTQRFSEEVLGEYKIQQEEMELDPITRLTTRTKFGRPDFSTIYDELKEAHIGEKIGVFFCGPRILSKNLRAFCMSKSPKSKKTGAKFVFHKENF